ncbi:helix-turn-helix domain-containing protein [Kineosporia babensis]|uniref:AraC family transcriptional regulator n=1 Tax=Kineosporia babensis TaxID=499548 RepID=A0A9X1STZ3_9ACTN|nr:AraC family transcriptional regulator [Kineosporia babensis]MCD5311846.1 AraC family transcriptional regulator [Kineosporia babensis]
MLVEEKIPVHTAVVPEGYSLTTRALAYQYLDDRDGCQDTPHAHPEHTVFWPARGSAVVEIEGRQWSLSTGQGLWVPAGVVHRADRGAGTTLSATYVIPQAWPRPVGEVGPVVVNAALREMLIHLAVTGMPREQRLRAQRVCLELITDEERPTIELPLPRDERIAQIARSIISDPADDRSIEHWAMLTSQSARTIARGFRAETGLTFSQWRTYARLTQAVSLLGDGVAVGTVARRVGYTTNSAFTAAFQRVMRQPPRAFMPTRNP